MTFVFIELMVNFFREIILTLLKAETVGEAGQKSLGKFSAAIGRWRKAVAAVAPKRRYGAPRRRKDYRSPRRFARIEAAGGAARFWSAPVLWRFGSGSRRTRRYPSGPRTPQVGKAVEDYRSPRRFARIEAAGGAARFWSAPVLWRFGSGSRRTRRYPSGPRTPQVGKAVEDYRSPRRFARIEAAGGAARFWSAPVLWRFGSGSRRTRRYPSGPRTPQVGKAVEDYRSPRRFARIEAAGGAARFWSAPVVWRFGSGSRRTRRYPSGPRTPQVGKAVEDYRSPRRFARIEAADRAARFWSAPVLWRFEVELPKGVAETKRWTHASHWGKVVEDYRSPRRFATVEGGGKSARFWSAPVLWRFSSPFRRGIEVVGQIE